MFLDADDFLCRGIEAGVTCMRTNPDLGFAFGSYTGVAADGRRLWDRTIPIDSTDVYAALLARNVVELPAAAVFRRRRVLDAGGFDPALKAAEDWDLLLRLSRAHPAAQHRALVACYRQHDKNMSHRNALMLETSLKALRKAEALRRARCAGREMLKASAS